LSSVESGKTIDVTLPPEDAYGNKETVGGLIVAFELSNMNGGGQETFATVTDNYNGTYTATFTGTNHYSNTFFATNGVEKVTSPAPRTEVTETE
jgi:hypothetical protein